jgi:hypothetical protein
MYKRTSPYPLAKPSECTYMCVQANGSTKLTRQKCKKTHCQSKTPMKRKTPE